MNVSRVGVLCNHTKENGLPVAQRLAELLLSHGCSLQADLRSAELLGCEELASGRDPG